MKSACGDVGVKCGVSSNDTNTHTRTRTHPERPEQPPPVLPFSARHNLCHLSILLSSSSSFLSPSTSSALPLLTPAPQTPPLFIQGLISPPSLSNGIQRDVENLVFSLRVRGRCTVVKVRCFSVVQSKQRQCEGYGCWFLFTRIISYIFIVSHLEN